MNNASLKANLSQIFINSADLVEYKQADGSASKTLFVRIPYRSLPAFRRVSEKVVQHLEGKFNWPVIVIATRTIISKWGKCLVPQLHEWLLPSFVSWEAVISLLTYNHSFSWLLMSTLNIIKLIMHLYSQETQNSKETQKQNSYRCPRCRFGRYRNIYYKPRVN